LYLSGIDEHDAWELIKKTVSMTDITGITLPQSPEEAGQIFHNQGYIDIPYSFTVENSGKTPAINMSVRANAALQVEPSWPDVTGGPKFLQVLFPGKTGVSYSTVPIRVTFPDSMIWERGEKHVYVYILIEYNDIFPNTKKHHTRVCAKFDAFGAHTFCHTGNSAD
jgi:hypothetical protein